MIADDARTVAVTVGQHQPVGFTAAPQTITCSCGDTLPGGAVQHIQHTSLAVVVALQLHTAEQVLELARLKERLDLVTCHICEELMIPGEDVLPTSDSWLHVGCATEGP